MKYALQMGSDAMIYVPSVINIGSGIQKLIGGFTDTHADSMAISQAYFYFFKIRTVG
jgi:hypothetical protein